MNTKNTKTRTLKTIDTYYIRSDRTIDCIVITEAGSMKIVYLYNDQGLYYYLFMTLTELMDFLENRDNTKISLNDEDIDAFLLSLPI